MSGRRNKEDNEDVSDQFQGGMDLNKDGQQGGGYGGGQDSGYGGQITDSGYGAGQDTGSGYGGGQSTDTGYGGEKKHHHHKKEGDDDTSGGYGGGNQSGYGSNTGGDDSTGYGGDSTVAQGYGGGDSALGGGRTGGDQFPRQEHERSRQAKDDAFGGDQTGLDAGADTNYGDTAGQTRQGNYGDSNNYGSGDASGYAGVAAGAGGGAAAGGAAYTQDRGAGGYGGGDAQQSMTSLSAGDSLRPGQSLASAGGQSKLVFQEDGNIVLYKGSQAVWATGTDREKVKPTALNIQEDGNVALYGHGNHFVGWATNTGGRASGAVKLVVSDSGILVLLSEEEALWSSTPVQANEARDIATQSAQSGGQGGQGGQTSAY